jgi:hypothetical protein
MDLPLNSGVTAVQEGGYREEPKLTWRCFASDGRFLGTLTASSCNGEPSWAFNDVHLAGWYWNVEASSIEGFWAKRVAVSDEVLAPLGVTLKAAFQACRDSNALGWDAHKAAWAARDQAVNACRAAMGDDPIDFDAD